MQVIAGRARQAQPVQARRHTGGRHVDLAPAGEISAGQRFAIGLNCRRRAVCNDAATMFAGAQSHVDHVIGGANRFLIVLDHEHRVAEVAQMPQGRNQAIVVALVQADRRLVEHVHDAGQAGADLRGEANALRLAPRQCVGRALERQVVQADIIEEFQAHADFTHDALADIAFGTDQLELREITLRRAQRQPLQLVDRAPLFAVTDEHKAGRALQAGAIARRAGAHAAIFGELFLDRGRIGLAPAPPHDRQDAFKGVPAHDPAAALAVVGKRDLLVARSVQYPIPELRRQLLPRRLQIDLGMFGERNEQLEVVIVARVPAANRACGERHFRVRDHPPLIEEFDRAQSVAALAGADRIVEREQARLQFSERVAADGTGESIGEHRFDAVVRVEQ